MGNRNPLGAELLYQPLLHSRLPTALQIIRKKHRIGQKSTNGFPKPTYARTNAIDYRCPGYTDNKKKNGAGPLLDHGAVYITSF